MRRVSNAQRLEDSEKGRQLDEFCSVNYQEGSAGEGYQPKASLHHVKNSSRKLEPSAEEKVDHTTGKEQDAGSLSQSRRND
jgi:hypothetical protein